MAQPKRLPLISYDQLAAYYVTSVTQHRVKAFDLKEFGPLTANAIVAIASDFKFAVTVYVVMPDHVHLLLAAMEEGADFKKMMKTFKQRTGFEWSQRTGRRLWQKGYFERVLRDDDVPLPIARYIAENPVRAALVDHPLDYPLSGSTVYTMEEICEAAQMDGWWTRRRSS